jgi:hypothetical protein
MGVYVCDRNFSAHCKELNVRPTIGAVTWEVLFDLFRMAGFPFLMSYVTWLFCFFCIVSTITKEDIMTLGEL